MNWSALALGVVFLAIGFVFRSNAAREPDPARAKGTRLASSLFFLASAAFFVAAAFRFFGD